MWCELVLCGIGGRTIAEAKERMSTDEYELWLQYRKRHGTLNLGLRIEQGAALTAYCANNGKKGQLADYLPQRGEPDDSAALTQAMKEWK